MQWMRRTDDLVEIGGEETASAAGRRTASFIVGTPLRDEDRVEREVKSS